MAPQPKAGPPAGYLEATIHALTAAKVRATGAGAAWAKPIHGTSVLVTPEGKVLGHVRTLGIRLPVKDRRYSLRVPGVTFTRMVPFISATKPIQSDLAAYDTMKAAQAAGLELIGRMMVEGAETVPTRPPRAWGSAPHCRDCGRPLRECICGQP